MKTIGIKLADGSFFPVMEDSHPAQKALELTTAHNNQTKVMVDLYRSKSCSMDDAEYVDSLQIDNLVSHPNGEPSIAFSVSLDENSQLSANIRDPETGHQSETAIPLITRSEEDLLVTDEYDISNIDEDDKAEPNKNEETDIEKPEEKRGLLSAADKIMENKKKTDLDEPIFGDDALPDFGSDTNNIADISNDDMFSTDEFLNFDNEAPTNEETTETEDFTDPLPDFEDSTPEDAVIVNEEEVHEPQEELPEETAIFNDQDLSDFDIPEQDSNEDIIEEPTSENIPNFDSDVTTEDADDIDNLPDFGPDIATENPDLDSLSEFDSEIIPENADVLPDSEPEDTPEEQTPENIPNFDSDVTTEDTDIDNLPDFGPDIATEDSDLDNLPDFDFDSTTSEPENEINNTEPQIEASENINSIETDDTETIPDFNFKEIIDDPISDNISAPKSQDTETYDLPDFDFNETLSDSDDFSSDLDQFPRATSPIDDFSLPDFPEDNSSPELPDNFFDDLDDFDNTPSTASFSGADPLSFTGLYDKETEMGMSGMQNDEISKKTKLPVIICTICALICIAATAFILFAKPKFDTKSGSTLEQQEEIILDKNKTTENNQIKIIEEETQPLPPPVPEAKEDEIIIIEQAEKVIPKQPEVIKEKLNDISYEVIWGDTLWDIANTYYKNPWKYTDIAKYNNIKNPDYIISGTTLVIPAE